MKVLITGGAGFIGKYLLARLPADAEVVVVDSLDDQIHKQGKEFPPEVAARAVCVHADVCDGDHYAAAAEGTDVVVHLAAQTGTGQSMYEMSRYVRQNADGTARLLEVIHALKRKPRRIILASSRAVYGEGAFGDPQNPVSSPGRRVADLEAGRFGVYDAQGRELPPLKMQEDHPLRPTSVYGLTKLWQEQLVENYAHSVGLDYLIFRFQNVYGPGQELRNPYTGIMGIFVNATSQGQPIELFEDGNISRDFVLVDDIASAVARGITHAGALNTYLNVGSGQGTNLWQLVEHIARATGKTTKVTCSGRFRIGDVRYAVADMRHYEQLFGPWKPTSLEEGLRRYVDWYLTQKPVEQQLLESSLKEMEAKGLLRAHSRQ